MDLNKIRIFKEDAEVKKYLSEIPLAEKNKFLLEVKLLEFQIKELENSEKDKRNDFIRLLISIVIGSLLTGLISLVLLKAEKQTQVYPIIHVKNQIFHDTIYIAIPNILKDTSYSK